jgi:hypothetical protein
MTLAEVIDFLKNTLLSDAKVIELEIPESTERAIAIQIDRDNAIAAWELMQSKIGITGRYPVIVADAEYPKASEDWGKSMQKSNFFSRVSFDRPSDPISIIERSRNFNVDKLVEEYDDEFYEQFDDQEEIDELLQNQLDWMEEEIGKAPTLAEVGVSVTGKGIHEDRKFQRWLFEWQLANISKENSNNEDIEEPTDRTDWFSDYQTHYALMLLPTANSYDTFAYIHWGYAVDADSSVACFRRWHERYGANLVCHYGVYLYLNVDKQPLLSLDAFDLAVEHYALASDLLDRSGYSLREYAGMLPNMDTWYFLDRP